jgi:hypothetical protein
MSKEDCILKEVLISKMIVYEEQKEVDPLTLLNIYISSTSQL